MKETRKSDSSSGLHVLSLPLNTRRGRGCARFMLRRSLRVIPGVPNPSRRRTAKSTTTSFFTLLRSVRCHPTREGDPVG
jgi:hypothetical protein